MSSARRSDAGRSAPLNRGRRGRRGVAMLEALMVLPVLWILALGVPFVRDRYLSQQRAALQARRCAWEHAINGCRSIPNGCEEALAQSGSWSGPTRVIAARKCAWP